MAFQGEEYFGVVTPSVEAALQQTVSALDKQEALALARKDKIEKKNITMANQVPVSLEQGTRFAHVISRLAIAKIPALDKNNANDPSKRDKLLTAITAKDIEKMGRSSTRLTGHMNDVIDEIMSYRIKILSVSESGGKKLTAINFFMMASIAEGQKAIFVQLNPALYDYFVGLKADFTQYSTEALARMQGYAPNKLHELLLSKARKYGRNLLLFDIDDLAALLNYEPESQFREAVFVNSVIKRGVEAINKNTELRVEYKTIKQNRASRQIRFYVDASAKSLQEKETAMKKDMDTVIENGDGTKTTKAAIKASEIEMLLNTGAGEMYFSSMVPSSEKRYLQRAKKKGGKS